MASVREAVCEKVARQYPEMRGVRPKESSSGPNRVYTFRKTLPVAPDGPRVTITVRATVDRDGRVVKVVASKG